MNRLDKWIFDSIDLQNPIKKIQEYYSYITPIKMHGYYLCHFITKDGYAWAEFLKPNNNGYIITKYGQIFDVDYDRSLNTYRIVE